MLAVDEDGAVRRFTSARKTDADIGGFGFARSIDDAAHDGEREVLDALVATLPCRHLLADVVLRPLGELLERAAGRAAATRTRRNARRECAQAERLQQLARGVDLFATIAARTRCQRDADRVTDPLVEQDADRRCRPHEALHPHAGFGESEMQRLIGLAREVAVDGDQIARPRHLARNDDLILAQAGLEREGGGFDSRDHHALVEDLFGGPAETPRCVLFHLRDDELLIERAAVDADAHRLAVVDGDLADRGELLVAPPPGADVARIDPVFVERRRAGGETREQEMAVVVKVADERGVAAGIEHALLDLGHGSSRFRQVHRDAHELGSRFGQLDALLCRGLGISGVGHRHRLHDNGSSATDLHASDADTHGLVKFDGRH